MDVNMNRGIKMKPVSVDEFCNFAFLSGLTFSPEGNSLAFVATRANLEKNCYESRIYIKKGQELFALTNGGKEGNFRFLDENSLVFMGNREEGSAPSVKSHLYRISLKGGEAEKFITFPIPVKAVTPLKNGDFIVEGVTFPGYEDLYKGNEKLAAKYLEDRKENEDYEVLTQNPWWWNGGSFTRGTYGSIYYYHAKKGTLTRLTDPGFSAAGVRLSADETYIYFCGKEVKALNLFNEESLYRMNLKTRECQTLLPATKDFMLFDYQLADDFILIAAAPAEKGVNSNCNFYKMDYETLNLSLYAPWGEALSSTVGSDVRYGGGRYMKVEGNTCYFIGTVFDSAYLYKLEDGVITKVIDKEGSVDCFDVCQGKIALTALWDMKGIEIYDEKCHALTGFNKNVLKNKYVAIPEKFTFVKEGTETYNAHEIHGFVLRPMNFDENKSYPVIFDIHGGPKTVFGEVYYHEMQYWAGKGYFVIYCNPTGSDGRGNEFMDIRGKYGTVDFDDLMAFADEALARYPQMDASRFYETGGSYGGFMTNWIIGHTDRFRACASQRSISNWFSFYGVADIGIGFTEDQNASTPWDNPEKLWWHSPLRYADQVKTPTLFIHSTEDYRCPIDQGYQMFTALLAHGIDTKLVQFKGENHDLSRTGKPKHRIRRLNEITAWFESH